jgi:hypothetical protein
MRELIEEEKAEARKSGIKLGVGFACAVGAASIGMFVHPISGAALGSAFLSVGGWLIDHIPSDPGTLSPAAMCLTAEREFGWMPPSPH